jgi:hypothetical protein
MFENLSKVDVNEHTEKKGRFTYLSWPFAWAEVKKVDPGANFTVYSDEDGRPYFDCGSAGAFVKVGVTVNGIEHIETFPILDNRNKTIPSDKLNVFDINTSHKRGMVKAIAMHGLGLYIYAGEDLPLDAPKKPKVNKQIVPSLNDVPF